MVHVIISLKRPGTECITLTTDELFSQVPKSVASNIWMKIV